MCLRSRKFINWKICNLQSLCQESLYKPEAGSWSLLISIYRAFFLFGIKFEINFNETKTTFNLEGIAEVEVCINAKFWHSASHLETFS